MTFKKPAVAALAAVAAFTGAVAVADGAEARGRTTFSLSIGGPGYAAYYGNGYGYRPYRYGYARPYYGRGYYAPRYYGPRYYGPRYLPRYYGARYRCDRPVWNGWRWVIVRGRC